MAIGLRKKKAEILDEMPAEAEASSLAEEKWSEPAFDPFMSEEAEEEVLATAPAAARPARPERPRNATVRARRMSVLAIAGYVLLFVTVASLSAALVLVVG